MPIRPLSSPGTLAEWTGAHALMQKWLVRRSASESVLNLAGGFIFLILGLIALVFTSAVAAASVLFLLLAANASLAFFGLAISLLRPMLFAGLFVLFMVLTIVNAYKTRSDVDTPARFDIDLSLGFGLVWEFVSAGPVLLVMSGQEFHRYLRLTRMDVPQVSALLLWVFDKGGRASFAEICLAFPGLNAVRVLPQLRDIPGIHWWPDDAELSFSEELLKSLAEALHREPKSAPFTHSHFYERQRPQEPVVEIDENIRAWYATLNLPLFAPLQDVKKRYRKLAKIHHPDVQSAKAAGNKTANDEEMKRINEAYHNILRHSQTKGGAPL